MILELQFFWGIGDLLFVTPTLRKLKESFPEVEVVINTCWGEILEKNPFVDKVGNERKGHILYYPDPRARAMRGTLPTQHHIYSDWDIVRKITGLDIPKPDLCPDIYHCISSRTSNTNPPIEGIGVQVLSKPKRENKTWPKFRELAEMDGFEPIPRMNSIKDLVQKISTYRAVVCAEGGISHIAKSIGTPAVVVYGGFAHPEWNGYQEHINLTNEKHCSYCYVYGDCVNDIPRRCLVEITLEEVREAVRGVSRIPMLHQHNNMKFVKEDAGTWLGGNGIDVGGGKYPLPGARCVDKGSEENAYRILERDGSLDYVFSSHCLEHLDDPERALAEWVRVLKVGGLLYLYLPSPDYLLWRPVYLSAHLHSFSIKDVNSMLGKLNLQILEVVERDSYWGQKWVAKKR